MNHSEQLQREQAKREQSLAVQSLAEHLVRAKITGTVATPRDINLLHIRKFLASERQFDFGVKLTRDWDFDNVFALMVDRCGINPDAEHLTGVDTISTTRCIEQLEVMRAAILDVSGRGGRILFATGHPSGLFPVHAALHSWAISLGASSVNQDARVPVEIGGDVRNLLGVWMWHQHGGLPHTHLAEPGQALLATLTEPVDLVVADHGWAGGLASAGLRTVGFADCNDPALFVAQAQGQVEACVPLDDNVVPHLYEPLVAYMTRGA